MQRHKIPLIRVLVWRYLLDPLRSGFDPAEPPELRMREQPQLARQRRAAPLSANSSQPRVAVSDNARQQRSTKSSNHGFEQSFGVVERTPAIL